MQRRRLKRRRKNAGLGEIRAACKAALSEAHKHNWVRWGYGFPFRWRCADCPVFRDEIVKD